MRGLLLLMLFHSKKNSEDLINTSINLRLISKVWFTQITKIVQLPKLPQVQGIDSLLNLTSLLYLTLLLRIAIRTKITLLVWCMVIEVKLSPIALSRSKDLLVKFLNTSKFYRLLRMEIKQRIGSLKVKETLVLKDHRLYLVIGLCNLLKITKVKYLKSS